MDRIGTLGIYGGTFSPPHDGHGNAVSAFLCECPLDKLYVIPANIPPHKRIDSSDDPANRLEMTKLMLEDHPEWNKRLFISDWEIKQKEKSYTVYTLRYFKQFADKLLFLMGTDMLLSFNSWYRPEEICSLATLVLMRREEPNGTVDRAIENQIDLLKDQYKANIIQLKSKVLPLDSTSIRNSLAQGNLPHGISGKVYDYIKQHNLYGT